MGVGHVHAGQMRHAYKILVTKPEGMRPIQSERGGGHR